MSKQPTNDDAEVRRLLERDSSEPPAYLDDEIRAAARDALADTPAAGRSASSRWPLPALAGVAATALLAVLVVQLAAPPTLEVELDAVEQPAPAQVKSAPPSVQFTQELRRESSRAADEGMTTTAAGSDAKPLCPAGSEPLVALGMLICMTPEHLTVHSTQPDGCSDTLQLAWQPGEVEVAPATDGIEVLIDGELTWRVGCFDGTWRVRSIVRRDLNDAPEPRVSSDID
jgi:hypothetical protein